MKWSWTGPISAQLAIGEAYYESEPRPGLVDGAHLVVDEPCGEADLAHRVLVQIGRHGGSLLRPGDPQPARALEPARQPGEAAIEVRPPFGEEHHHVGGAA